MRRHTPYYCTKGDESTLHLLHIMPLGGEQTSLIPIHEIVEQPQCAHKLIL